MANAWAFSALWVGLAFIVKRPTMGFRASTALKETAPSPGARRIIGAHFGHRWVAGQQTAESVSFRYINHTTSEQHDKTILNCELGYCRVVHHRRNKPLKTNGLAVGKA
jgi:hypothetical protein